LKKDGTWKIEARYFIRIVIFLPPALAIQVMGPD